MRMATWQDIETSEIRATTAKVRRIWFTHCAVSHANLPDYESEELYGRSLDEDIVAVSPATAGRQP